MGKTLRQHCVESSPDAHRIQDLHSVIALLYAYQPTMNSPPCSEASVSHVSVSSPSSYSGIAPKKPIISRTGAAAMETRGDMLGESLMKSDKHFNKLDVVFLKMGRTEFTSVVTPSVIQGCPECGSGLIFYNPLL